MQDDASLSHPASRQNNPSKTNKQKDKTMDFKKIIANIKDGKLAEQSAPRPRIVAGSYTVKATSAEYGANQAKTGFRGMIKMEVVDGELSGALVNVYINEGKDEDQLTRNIAPFILTLISAGIPGQKIIDDAETAQELIQNIIAKTQKLITRGTVLLYDLQVKETPKHTAEKPDYYKNVFAHKSEQTSTSDLTAPAPETKASKASTKLGPDAVDDLANDEDGWID